MKVPYNYLDAQFKDPEPFFKDLRELIASGEFTLGPYVEKFERKFADYIRVKHVISTNTGTDALILALKSLGVGPSDEVITAANSFYASAGAIAALGARPVFVDSDERYSIDATKIERAITPRTRALLPVHWAGWPPDMEMVLSIAARHGLPVVEDACPAVGAKIGERFAGTFGKVNAFSMHPLKPLNVMGDGGMIATDDDNIARFLRMYRNHGMTDRDHIDMWGVNARLQPFQAVVATRLLDSMEDVIAVRIRNAKRLDAGLTTLKGFVKVPPRRPNMREVYQLYIVSVAQRTQLLKHLVANGIEAKVHYPVPLHLQKPGRALGYKEGDCPIAEAQAQEIITLPSHQHLTEEQMDYTVEMITAFYRGKS